MASLDLVHEDAPNPAWLRQLAETLKLEAAVLEGHAETLPIRGMNVAGHAVRRMRSASGCLLSLADVLDETAVES